MQRLIDAWFDIGRKNPPTVYRARTRDGWKLALYRYRTARSGHKTPVLLCHGMTSNRWDMDGPGRISLARFLAREGYDVWNVELRGAGRSTRPTWWNGKRYDWSFEDYVQHDAPSALQTVLRETGAAHVHWVGHSMGGMIAYALLMSPAHRKIASAVTVGSPTMSDVGHPLLDFGLPYRSLLRFIPRRLPVGLAARIGAPLTPLLSRALDKSIAELGFYPGNADTKLLRTLLLTAIDDLPASLLQEFARWYDNKTMQDRYALFDFTEHLERITTPLLIIAGSHDHLTPVRDLKRVYRAVSSPAKEFRIVGKKHGAKHNYSHADLILGLHAPDDVYPIILRWLEKQRRNRSPRRRSSKRAATKRPAPRLQVVPRPRQDTAPEAG